jgi:hypothetical protein
MFSASANSRSNGKGTRRGIGGLNAAALVCVFLLLLLAVVQVAHVHPLESATDHCPLCVVMHSAAVVVVVAMAVLLVQVGTPTLALPMRAAPLAWWQASLFVRPPPMA